MALEKFITIICGAKSLTLCQNLAIAHTNSSIGGITPIEAHKYLVNKHIDFQEYNFNKSFWLELRDELSSVIREAKNDKDYLNNKISEILMEFAIIASYFIANEENNIDQSVNKLFNCIVETYLKATANCSYAAYEDILSSNETSRKWNRESLQTIAKIGTALRKFANLLQGCIYAVGLRNTVSYYQELCGVYLTTEFSNATIADATFWTKTYTKKVCKIKNKNNPNLTSRSSLDICELKQARDKKLINEDGVVLVSLSELVMHFYEERLFMPLIAKSFKPIDGLLRTENGVPVTAKQLARVATDLQKNYYIDRNTRYNHSDSSTDKTQ